MKSVTDDPQNREKDDFYPTHPQATWALLDKEHFDGVIWEPACGDGAISKVLIENGEEVYSSDLVDRGYGDSRVDFLMEYTARAPNIITNPPFRLGQKFVEKSLEITGAHKNPGKIAMLLKLTFLEGVDRQPFFKSTPLARVHVFSNRVPFKRNGTDGGRSGKGMIAFAWFVWEHGHEGPPVLDWIPPVEWC